MHKHMLVCALMLWFRVLGCSVYLLCCFLFREEHSSINQFMLPVLFKISRWKVLVFMISAYFDSI